MSTPSTTKQTTPDTTPKVTRSTVAVDRIIKEEHVLIDGVKVVVKPVTDLSLYAEDVTIYSKQAVKGKAKGSTIYAVAVDDFIAQRGVSASAKLKQAKEQQVAMLADMQAGMSVTDLQAKYGL